MIRVGACRSCNRRPAVREYGWKCERCFLTQGWGRIAKRSRRSIERDPIRF